MVFVLLIPFGFHFAIIGPFFLECRNNTQESIIVHNNKDQLLKNCNQNILKTWAKCYGSNPLYLNYCLSSSDSTWIDIFFNKANVISENFMKALTHILIQEPILNQPGVNSSSTPSTLRVL